MNIDKNNLGLIYESSVQAQRTLMKEIQRRKAANESPLTPAEREAFLQQSEPRAEKNRFISRGYFTPKGVNTEQSKIINPNNVGHLTSAVMMDLDLNSNTKISEFLLKEYVPDILQDMNIYSITEHLCRELKWNYSFLEKIEMNPSDGIGLRVTPIEPLHIAGGWNWNNLTPLNAFPKSGVYISITRRMYDSYFVYEGVIAPQTANILAEIKTLINRQSFPMPYMGCSRTVDQLGIH